jgi:hypothetical protein
MIVTLAAASFDTAWEDNILPFLKSDPTLKNMSLSDFASKLFALPPAKLGVKPDDVFENAPDWNEQYRWKHKKGHAFRGIAEEMYDLIRQGKSDEAYRMGLTYSVGLSQWVYGPIGNPPIMRGTIMRNALMYFTWSANYAEFEGMLISPSGGLWRRAIAMHLIQLLLVGGLVGSGLTAARKWILLGPIPEQLGFTGPLVSMLNDLWAWAIGGVKVKEAELLYGASEKETQFLKRESEESGKRLKRTLSGW